MSIPPPNCPRCATNIHAAYHMEPEIKERGSIVAVIECDRCDTTYTATWDVYDDPWISMQKKGDDD